MIMLVLRTWNCGCRRQWPNIVDTGQARWEWHIKLMLALEASDSTSAQMVCGDISHGDFVEPHNFHGNWPTP